LLDPLFECGPAKARNVLDLRKPKNPVWFYFAAHLSISSFPALAGMDRDTPLTER
jgi:hypothetical protein